MEVGDSKLICHGSLQALFKICGMPPNSHCTFVTDRPHMLGNRVVLRQKSYHPPTHSQCVAILQHLQRWKLSHLNQSKSESLHLQSQSSSPIHRLHKMFPNWRDTFSINLHKTHSMQLHHFLQCLRQQHTPDARPHTLQYRSLCSSMMTSKKKRPTQTNH